MAKRNPIPGTPQPEPWKPIAWDPPDVACIQALSRGDASPDQQKRAITLIINRLASTYDMSYRPNNANDTIFAEGKRYVGLQLVKMLHLNLGAISGKPREQP